MRKLTIKEKDIRNSVQKVAASCSCKYSCSPGENVHVVAGHLYQGSTQGGGLITRVEQDI